MAADDKKPIVIKRIKKVVGGHHGGAWKIAYADFVTAMMAFFLLMWLLGSTTKGTLLGISEYFKTPLKVALMGGQGSGDSSSIIKGGGRDLTRSTGQVKEGELPTQKKIINLKAAQAELLRLEKQRELDKLKALKSNIEKAIESNEKLRKYKSQILLDITSEGLRIQIVDKENRPMFDSSSAILKSYTKRILEQIGKIINTVPNHISIAGHTDATPFATRYIYVEYGSFEERRAYTNWELSADRANAARRELIIGGMHKNKIARVVGLADSVLFDKANPYDPINRRISIIVLNKETEAAIGVLSGKAGVKPQDIPQRLKAGAKPKS